MAESRAEFDPKRAPEGWDYEKQGKPDILFWRYAGEEAVREAKATDVESLWKSDYEVAAEANANKTEKEEAKPTDEQTVDNTLKRDIIGADTEAGSNQRASDSENIPWDSWQNYEKVFVDSHEYALVGKRLYSQHAVNRMQPSGNRFGPNIYQGINGRDYGRSIAPNLVEHIIRTVTPTIQENGNLMYALGNVRVITNKKGCVVTILTYMN